MKEEILRAIEAMQYLDESSRGILFKSLTGKEEREQVLQGIRIATRLLQEQLDRLEGCVDCNNINKCDLCKRKNVVRNSYPCLGCKYNCVSKHRGNNTNFEQCVFYCPNCGRKLRGGEDES